VPRKESGDWWSRSESSYCPAICEFGAARSFLLQRMAGLAGRNAAMFVHDQGQHRAALEGPLHLTKVYGATVPMAAESRSIRHFHSQSLN